MSSPRWLNAAATVALVVSAATCRADVEPVSISANTEDRWVGQRAVFYVTLRGEGPFTGAASFSLPQVPRCVIMKVGDPVVGTEDHDDESWYTQTHEFALFSQREGAVEVPPFSVRFGNQKDTDSEIVDRDIETAPLEFTIKRPEGGDPDAFVVTTTDITITEKWDPPLGPAQQGAVFHRTIRQVADETTGMALAPPPTTASDGVRVHAGRPSVSDRTDRGDLRGSRSDTITYVLEAAGTLYVPAIKYVWWDPVREEFGSKTLPVVAFDVAAVPGKTAADLSEPRSSRWWFLLVAIAACASIFWLARRKLTDCGRRLTAALNPPERVAARSLLRACQNNDASEAEVALLQWRLVQGAEAPMPSNLCDAARELDRYLYGPDPSTGWSGHTLASALRQYRLKGRRISAPEPSRLPRLNPSAGIDQ